MGTVLSRWKEYYESDIVSTESVLEQLQRDLQEILLSIGYRNGSSLAQNQKLLLICPEMSYQDPKVELQMGKSILLDYPRRALSACASTE